MSNLVGYGIFTIVDDPLNQQFSLDMSTTDSLMVSISPHISDSLKIIANPGGLVGIVNENEMRLSGFSLEQNYPNPFNPVTKIKYALLQNTRVRIELYDLIGRKIKVLVDDQKPAGYHTLIFYVGNLASGVYIYKIKAGEF